MEDENDRKFWDRISRATTPRRDAARWGKQRAAVHEIIHPHRPGSRLKWVFIALPALAAAALFFREFKNGPAPQAPPVVAQKPAPVPDAKPSVLPEDDRWDVRATGVTGEVVVTSSDGVDSLLEVDAPLEAGDQIEVPPDGSLEIAFAADSVMTFGSGSRLTVGSIEKKDSFFDMTVGTLIAKLNWEKRRGYAMRVRTPTAVAAVRGTEFAVEVQDDGVTDIGVFDEGKIAVLDRANPKAPEIMITPMKEIRFDRAARGDGHRRAQAMKRLARHHQQMGQLNRRQRHFRENWKPMGPERRRQWRREKMKRPEGPWKEKLRQRREGRDARERGKRGRDPGARGQRPPRGAGQGRQGGPRRGEQGQPRRGEQGQPRRGEQGQPRRGEQGQPRRGEQGQPRRGEQRQQRQGEQGRQRRGEQGRPRPGGGQQETRQQPPQQGKPSQQRGRRPSRPESQQRRPRQNREPGGTQRKRGGRGGGRRR